MASEPSSIFRYPAALSLVVNEKSVTDFELFLTSLQLWVPIQQLPPIYLYTTTQLQSHKWNYAGNIHTKPALDPYQQLNRDQMEKQVSQYHKGKTLWDDFMQEKIRVLAWALLNLPKEKELDGVLACDADLFWLGPLPEIPTMKTLALSPHYIRKGDETRYGIYNGGLLWTNNPNTPDLWFEACKTSTFFEQKAIEDLATQCPKDQLHVWPESVNYGWWRMYQSPLPSNKKQTEWTIFRSQQHSGILVQGKPLLCVHTHWVTTDPTTHTFNQWVASKLKLLAKQPKVASLLHILKTKQAIV